MSITVHTDPEQDQLYIALTKRALAKGAVRRTARIDENIALDYSARGKLLGIDITNASTVIGTAQMERPAIDALVGVKEAAALAGVRPSNFVRDYADRQGFPSPVAELSSGRIWRRSDVLSHIARIESQKRRRAS